jgi:hypothetical protein
VVQDAPWPDEASAQLARDACYDCHSNETEWWWATNIAPFSWLVQRDVDGAREEFNFSEWDGQPPAGEIAEAIDGEMPPFQYTLIHPGAKLTDAEKRTLLEGYAAGMAASGGQTGATPTSGSTADAGIVAITSQRCDSCHPADRALSYRTDGTAEALALIADMIRRGAQVTPEERRALVQHFTQ